MRIFSAISRFCTRRGHGIRAVWFALLAMHVPALIAVGGSILRGEGSFSVLSIVGLLATVAFFVLKCMDVPFLRMRGPGSKIAFLLVCAFVHRGVATGPMAEQIVENAPMIVVAGTLAMGSSRLVRRRVRRRVQRWVRDAIRTVRRSLLRAQRMSCSIFGLVPMAQRWSGVPIFRVGDPARGPPVLAF